MSGPLVHRPPLPPRRGSRLTSYSAILLLLLGAGFLLIMPGLIGAALVVGGLILGGVIGFHYFVWGRWLGEIIRREMEEETDEP